MAGNVDNGAHRYLCTFVTADGETDAGAVSAVVTVADKTVNGQVSLTSIPLGGNLVTSRKLYRTVAAGSTYLLLATIANNTATYTDNIADGSLGAQAPSTNTTVDPYVTNLITGVRERAEGATWRQMNTATWDLTAPAFPCGTLIELPKAPLISVTHVKYVNANGTLTTLTVDTDYVVHAYAGPRCRRGLIELAYGESWPTVREQLNAVQIRFVAGYGATAASVPRLLRQAMLIDAGTLYEHREEVIVGTITAQLPRLTADIYRQFKSWPRYASLPEAA